MKNVITKNVSVVCNVSGWAMACAAAMTCGNSLEDIIGK